jgi:hypothetical protein
VRLKEKGIAKEVLAVSMGPPVVQVGQDLHYKSMTAFHMAHARWLHVV